MENKNGLPRTYLLKPGELTLKGGNKREFERVLIRNLEALLRFTGAAVSPAQGRYFVHSSEDGAEKVEEALSRLIGISGWAKTRVCGKTPEEVLHACTETAGECYAAGIRTFKIEARRTDKSFPWDSYGIRSRGGAAILDVWPDLRVDVHKPQTIINVEIRDRAYVYGMEHRGLRGLPVGTAGRGLLLLSGGIDSPVAGFMMLSRGMKVDAVYFHAYPYTSEEARQKAARLAEILSRYALGIKLYTVGFTAVQLRVKERAPEPWSTVLLRMAMMDCAEKLAQKTGLKCLITGESLSQVASQTIENLTCAQSRIRLPVLRPLIGMDKEDIIRKSEAIGAYATSILPYADCCVIFSPLHPVLRGTPRESEALYEKLDLTGLIEEALRTCTVETHREGRPGRQS
ncbi:MAG: tRNA 4-thiouridine(8) synthase ThiI [Treponema sp.]|jgi:thiamine biosynthesis protein ThiI|nr:tRNA 4-thiouridine(8) synthase ThiI [Treponema sp.]